jgi:glycogen operon protein
MATALLSQGVPMILAGDAIGHTQNGNNNAYCQDNETSWINWDPRYIDDEFLGFVQRLIALRKDHPVFRRRNFFQGRNIRGAGIKDIVWLKPDGSEMTEQEWNQEFARCLGVILSGEAVDEVDERGERIRDDNFLLLMNAHHEEIPFVLSTLPSEAGWFVLLDTSCQTSRSASTFYPGGESYPLQARSLALLVERAPNQVRGTERRRTPAA